MKKIIKTLKLPKLNNKEELINIICKYYPNKYIYIDNIDKGIIVKDNKIIHDNRESEMLKRFENNIAYDRYKKYLNENNVKFTANERSCYKNKHCIRIKDEDLKSQSLDVISVYEVYLSDNTYKLFEERICFTDVTLLKDLYRKALEESFEIDILDKINKYRYTEDSLCYTTDNVIVTECDGNTGLTLSNIAYNYVVLFFENYIETSNEKNGSAGTGHRKRVWLLDKKIVKDKNIKSIDIKLKSNDIGMFIGKKGASIKELQNQIGKKINIIEVQM